MVERDGVLAIIEALGDPLEVWQAVEGDRADLVALLRSDKTLNRQTRDALADWLDGKLKPVTLPAHRPPKEPVRLDLYYGHDPRTGMGMAGYLYDVFSQFIHKKGWNLKKAGKLYWSTERLQEHIAKRCGVDLEKFVNYRRNHKKHKYKAPQGDYVERRRRQIANEIRRTKVAKKG